MDIANKMILNKMTRWWNGECGWYM